MGQNGFLRVRLNRHKYLLTLAIVHTLWPIETSPGRQIIKLYMGWARSEEDSLLRVPHITGFS